jgi:hypothetical protein
MESARVVLTAEKEKKLAPFMTFYTMNINKLELKNKLPSLQSLVWNCMLDRQFQLDRFKNIVYMELYFSHHTFAPIGMQIYGDGSI